MTATSTVSWDHTRLPIECSDDVTEQDLWALHRDLWTLAFPALGDDYQITLHELDSHVTAHPKNPELWFYRGPDDSQGLDLVSRTELRYGFPADEFNNPTFEYEVVHHWFRLGLAAAFERAVAMAADRGMRLEVPSLREELTQTHWRLASVGAGYRQVFAKGDSLTLFSADGWTPLEEIEPAYHERVREVAANGCGCVFCERFRGRARSILERADWQAVESELRAAHPDGLALFAAMLERRIAEAEVDPGRFDWALLAHARAEGATAIGADPEGASTIAPFLETVSAATEPAAAAVAVAVANAKSKPRMALLPLLRTALATTDPDALFRVVRVLMPKQFGTKSPLLKKHLDESLLASLATLPDRLAPVATKDADRSFFPVQEAAVKLGLAVVQAKPAPGSLDVVRAWLTSEHPLVRKTIGYTLSREVGGYGRRMEAYWDLALEVATAELLPEHLRILLERVDDVPPELMDAMVELLPRCDLRALGIDDLLAKAAEKAPVLNEALARIGADAS